MQVPTKVETFAMSGHLESIKLIDHADSSDRKWLGNHIFWAMRNERIIELRAVKPSEVEAARIFVERLSREIV